MLKLSELAMPFRTCHGAIGWEPVKLEASVSVSRTGSQEDILLEGHCFSTTVQLNLVNLKCMIQAFIT